MSARCTKGGSTARANVVSDVTRRLQTLDEWLDWLASGHGNLIDLGLHRSRAVADAMQLGRPAATVITVAGTNGKGSSVALLDAIFRAAGLRVGTYMSPHLVRYNERIRINGDEADDARICMALAEVERARGDVQLTYFEFATLAALSIFERSALDIVLLEVGLGGRLDAVNIVDADVALVATIGLDHEDWLGSTREQIALEKAGIMRRQRPVVCSDADAPETLLDYAKEIGADLQLLGVDYHFDRIDDAWTWWSADCTHARLPLPRLEGQHQLRNAAGVLKVVELLQRRHPTSCEHVCRGLSSVDLRGRFQRIEGEFEYVLDVAHNPQAIDSFVATLSECQTATKTHIVLGMLRTKDHKEVMRRLVPIADTWHLASLGGPYGADSSELGSCGNLLESGQRFHCHASVEAAHRAARADATPGDRIAVLGSFLTVGAVLEALEPRPGAARDGRDFYG